MSLSDKKNHSFIFPSAQGTILCWFSPAAVTVSTKPPASFSPKLWYPSHAPTPIPNLLHLPRLPVCPTHTASVTRVIPDPPKDSCFLSGLTPCLSGWRKSTGIQGTEQRMYRQRGVGTIPKQASCGEGKQLDRMGTSGGRREEDQWDWLPCPCLLPILLCMKIRSCSNHIHCGNFHTHPGL